MFIKTNLTKTNDFNIQMINLEAKQPPTKKSAEPIESSLAAIQTLGRLNNATAKSLANQAQDLSKAIVDQINLMHATLAIWSCFGGVVGAFLGLAVEFAMLVSPVVTSVGLVLGCTFGTMGVIWLIAILAGIYFQVKENQSRENKIEEQKSALKELIAQNKEEITEFLKAKIETAQRERDSLLSQEFPAFSKNNNDKFDGIKKTVDQVNALDAIIEADNRSLDMLSKF